MKRMRKSLCLQIRNWESVLYPAEQPRASTAHSEGDDPNGCWDCRRHGLPQCQKVCAPRFGSQKLHGSSWFHRQNRRWESLQRTQKKSLWFGIQLSCVTVTLLRSVWVCVLYIVSECIELVCCSVVCVFVYCQFLNGKKKRIQFNIFNIGSFQILTTNWPQDKMTQRPVTT